jgi:Putative stage IV sporulation protein YqfD.
MKNNTIEAIKSKIKIVVKGKSANRYILKLHKNKIPLLKVDKVSKEEIYILIYFSDYERILELNTIYKISIIEYGGWISEKKKLHKNSILISSVFICLIILIILSRMIFRIEIITNDNNMKKILLSELEKYNISKFHFQKNYKIISQIKDQIIRDYKDEIEWLEIEKIGTKYIVRYEPRIIEEPIVNNEYRNLVAKKNAVIVEVKSSEGQVIKRPNEYVKKGDVIVSGYIYLNEEIKDIVSANGTVYGEVWYEVEVFYPFGYYEQIKTGNIKNVYVFQFLNWRIEMFNFNKFHDIIREHKMIIEDNALPIKFFKEKQIEVNIISSIQTLEEASIKAIDLALSKINKQLNEDEEIIKYKVIDRKIESNGVTLNIFFSVCEDITDYERIILLEEEKNE